MPRSPQMAVNMQAWLSAHQHTADVEDTRQRQALNKTGLSVQVRVWVPDLRCGLRVLAAGEVLPELRDPAPALPDGRGEANQRVAPAVPGQPRGRGRRQQQAHIAHAQPPQHPGGDQPRV